MNSEEFVESNIGLLKQIGRHTLRLNKSSVRKSLARGHLQLSVAEIDFFADKLTNAISYVKRRLRDQGSGKYLPGPCRSLLKVT